MVDRVSGKGGLPYYLRYVKDSLLERQELTLEERGAFDLIFDQCFYRGEPIDTDEKAWARKANVDLRVWRRVIKSLVKKRLVSLLTGNLITCESAMEMLEKAHTQKAKWTESGAIGGRKRVENKAESRNFKDLSQGGLKHRARENQKQENNTIIRPTERVSRTAQAELWSECERIRGKVTPTDGDSWAFDQPIVDEARLNLQSPNKNQSID